MTTMWLKTDLERDEGYETNAYPDPLTKGPPWTIGVGHTGREVHKGLVWTPAQIDTALDNDVNICKRGLDSALPWWRKIDDIRQDVLVNMAFNLGVGGLMEFHNTLTDVQWNKWDAAAEGILDSLAAKELPERYARLAEQMRCGERS